MELITVEEYTARVEPALMQVFNDSIFPLFGSISCPFKDSIEERTFMYRYSDNPFYESLTFWHGLITAILENGDEEFFEIDTLEGSCLRYILPDDANQLSFSTYRVFCSLQGNWGMLFDVDGISLLGGSNKFMATIRENFPEIDRHIHYFFENQRYWTERAKIEGIQNCNTEILNWLPNTLIHIFGEVRGKDLLSEAKNLGIYD